MNEPFGVKMLIRLRLGFGYLRKGKFRQDFKNYQIDFVPVVIS